MRDQHIEHIPKAKTVTLDTLLRENSFVIKKNPVFDELSEIEGLNRQGIDLAKIYPAKDKKGKPRIKEIARAEIKEVKWSKESGLTLLINMFATTKPEVTEINAKILVLNPSEQLTFEERVRIPDRFDQSAILQSKSLTCLTVKIAQKADELLNKFLENQRQQAANQTTTQDSQDNLLNNTTLPEIPS